MIDFEKIGRYSKAGPRYTSYPTALEFSEDISRNKYLKSLKDAPKDQPLSLYFHLPFCRSACYFCGCNVVYTSKEDKRLRYIDYIKKELAVLVKHLDNSRKVIQLHFGGGTPTFFTSDELDEVIQSIKKSFPNFSDDAEISCEVDPRYLNEEQMKVLQNGGFNRISFGVQDFNLQVQEAVHRVQSFEMTKKSVDLAREYGVKSINIDLIYGLPYQNLETFRDTLQKSEMLGADRFAVFNYAHVPWLMKTMRKIDEQTLPEPAEKLKIFKYTIDFFKERGYKMIGMDHFAKPDDELFLAIDKGELNRNFQGYTTKGGSQLIGIGLTSIGEGNGYYAQNFKDMKSYEESIDRGELPLSKGIFLTDDDKIRKAVIMELMSNFKLDIKRFEDRFKVSFQDYFKEELPELKPFINDELLTFDDNHIEVSETGVMLIRNISMIFDGHMKKYIGSKKTFSKTI